MQMAEMILDTPDLESRLDSLSLKRGSREEIESAHDELSIELTEKFSQGHWCDLSTISTEGIITSSIL